MDEMEVFTIKESKKRIITSNKGENDATKSINPNVDNSGQYTCPCVLIQRLTPRRQFAMHFSLVQ